MERKIGEIFSYKGIVTLEAVENNKKVCDDCYFFKIFMCYRRAKEVTGLCSHDLRTDKKDVIFKEI